MHRLQCLNNAGWLQFIEWWPALFTYQLSSPTEYEEIWAGEDIALLIFHFGKHPAETRFRSWGFSWAAYLYMCEARKLCACMSSTKSFLTVGITYTGTHFPISRCFVTTNKNKLRIAACLKLHFIRKWKQIHSFIKMGEWSRGILLSMLGYVVLIFLLVLSILRSGVEWGEEMDAHEHA